MQNALVPCNFKSYGVLDVLFPLLIFSILAAAFAAPAMEVELSPAHNLALSQGGTTAGLFPLMAIQLAEPPKSAPASVLKQKQSMAGFASIVDAIYNGDKRASAI